jgi:hypothetical protein
MEPPAMKSLLLFISMTLALPFLAGAQLVHYKGIRRDTYNGSGFTRTLNSKVLMIVDYQTANVAVIAYVNFQS